VDATGVCRDSGNCW
jgi:hypothetical protein